MNIIVYEDELYKNFLPLTWTRPVWDLRCGATTILERIKRKYWGSDIIFKGREPLVKDPGEKIDGQRVNGRILAITSREIRYPWDLVINLRQDLDEDLKYMGKKISGWLHPTVALYNQENMLIEEGAEIEAFAVLDARSGPIYIGKKTIIRPHAHIRGPVSIGPDCRIGGEVQHSIIHGNSNKGHYGFLGHSYVGEWVNLGAGTTNSNLKNNFGSVKMLADGKEIDTREQFLGCVIADHAKLGIGTLIPTGAIIGVSANLFSGGMIPKLVPSFTWGIKDEYKLDKAIECIAAVMRRRGRELSYEDKSLLQAVFEGTAAERRG
mgnify:CR=1 FL=1